MVPFREFLAFRSPAQHQRGFHNPNLRYVGGWGGAGKEQGSNGPGKVAVPDRPAICPQSLGPGQPQSKWREEAGQQEGKEMIVTPVKELERYKSLN